MRRFIFGIAIIFPLLTAAQSVPAGVVFTNEPQTNTVGAVSETITIQSQDGSGNAFKLPSTGCLALSSSASGEFSSSATSWSAVSVLTMNKNSANRNFYYQGNAAGMHTLTARLALKPETEERSCASWPIGEWPTGWSANQNMVVGAGGSDMPTQNPPPSAPPPLEKEGGGGGFSEPVPSLVVKISGQTPMSVGADATFSAQVFGTRKEPIPNARVLWSFGNGATREGASVRFAYNIPGSYLVSVDAASGGLAGTARLAVKVGAPEVGLPHIAAGPDGFVEIENRGDVELDVSGWMLESGALSFALPQQTLLLPRTKVAFPASVTGVFVAGDDARLLFPNGKVAAEYVPTKEIINIPRLPSGDTPLKGGIETIKKSPLEGSAPSIARGRDVSTTSAAISLSLSDEQRAGDLGPWLWGVAGIGVLGVGALAAFRFKPAVAREENEEQTFAKEVRIV